MKFFFVIIGACLALEAFAVTEIPMSVEEAYRSIPHKMQKFEASKSKLDAGKAQALEKLFTLVDRAVVARVWHLTQFRQGQISSQKFSVFTEVIADLNQLEKEAVVEREVLDLIRQGIKEHQEFFKAWIESKETGKSFAYDLSAGKPLHEKVRSSSQKMHQAYSLLMSKYSSESSQNKQSFFEHLCALDFI